MGKIIGGVFLVASVVACAVIEKSSRDASKTMNNMFFKNSMVSMLHVAAAVKKNEED